MEGEVRADFDGEKWFEDAKAYAKEAAAVGLVAHLEKSKSGNGAHAWIFFSEPYPCYKSRRIGLEIVRRALTFSAFDKEPSFDRLFPNQDSVPKDGFGNLIALPLQGNYTREGTMLFIDSENGEPVADQWAYLARMHKHDIPELDIALAHLEHAGATTTPASQPSKGKLLIHVGNKIELNRAELTSNTIHFLKDNLNFLSTEYLTRKRLGKSVYGVEKYFKLVEEVGDSVFLPRGFLSQLLGFLDAEGISYDVAHEHPNFEKLAFSNNIVLSTPQAAVVEKTLGCDQGVIVAPPGSGKTIIGLDLIARKGLPALVLVHRKELLEQWVERIQTFLNIPKLKIGRFHGVKKKIGVDITIGLIQSFVRTTDKSIFNGKFGTIVVDECHHIPASTFRKAVASLNPRYLYGLTATPKRKNNDEKLIYAYIGDIVATMTQSEKITAELSPRTNEMPEVLVHETNLKIPFEWKTDRFQLLSKIVSFDTERNRLISDDVTIEVAKGERVLVLSERKEHLDVLNLCLKGKCEVIQISGEDTSAKRFSKLKRIHKGNYQVILSTGQFFGEGIDVHNISVLVLAFPFSFEGKLVQYIGRLLHGSGSKRVIDYRDRNVAFLERQYKQRQRYYNKLKSRT